jgi:hypothetical protein
LCCEGLADIDRRSRALLDRWKGSDRTGIGVGPLVPWSATRDYWEHTRELVAGGVRAHLQTKNICGSSPAASAASHLATIWAISSAPNA